MFRMVSCSIVFEVKEFKSGGRDETLGSEAYTGHAELCRVSQVGMGLVCTGVQAWCTM